MLKNALAVSVLILSCCGYSPRALLPSHLKTVAVVPSENQTLKPGLDLLLTNAIIAGFQRDGSLRTADLARADITLKMVLNGYDKTAQTYSSGQQVNTWQIGLSARCECEDRVKSVKLWDGTVSVQVSYDASRETEEQGIAAAMDRLSAEIIRRTLIAW